MPRRTPLLALLPGLLCLVVALTVLSPGAASAAPAAGKASTGRTNQAMARIDERVVEIQRRMVAARSAYEKALTRRDLATERAAELAAQAELAGARAEELARRVDDQPAGGLTNAIASFVTGHDSEVDKALEAVDNEQHALRLARITERAAQDAERQVSAARDELGRAERAAAEVEVERAAQLAAQEAAIQAKFRRGYDVNDERQDRRNRRALKDWQAYLVGLGEAGIVPPLAKVLEDPESLTEPFEPVRDGRGRAVAGVAEVELPDGENLVVLPAETIRAVSQAFSLVGLPVAEDARAYACGGYAARAWQPTGLDLPAGAVGQWQQLHPVTEKVRQVGDLVFLEGETSRTGVFLGDGLVLAADPTTGTVRAQTVDTRDEDVVLGAARVQLPQPKAGPERTPVTCEVPLAEQPPATGTGADADAGWTWPVDEGSSALSAGFGADGGLWSSGQHTGQDFAAPVGTPVYAARAGVATVQRPSWAGNLVRIDHGNGIETWYAHLSEVAVADGQELTDGQVVGAVGDEGNSTGPHLHFEVRIDDTAVDPLTVLGSGAASALTLSPTGWGGFDNGAVPSEALCAATTGGHLLRCDAAVGYRLLDAAFTNRFGVPLCITDSYRSRHSQEELYEVKPRLAAVPGTSNHGWGLAVDLCGGAEEFGTAEHEFVVARGPAYGWVHPAWAAAGGSRPEPWHFEYAAGA